MWSTVRDKVRQRSRTTEVMLAGAVVRAVEDGTLVLAHESAPLAKRLTEQRNADVIRDALKDALGVDWRVRCEVGAGQPIPEPEPLPPEPAPDPVEAQRAEEDSMIAEVGRDDDAAPAPRPRRGRPGTAAERAWCPPDRRLGVPPRAQRQTAVATLVVELDGQNLVQLNHIGLEAQP